jgi:hypothetical protein
MTKRYVSWWKLIRVWSPTVYIFWSEEFRLLGYNTVYSVQNRGKFRRNISPPSPGSFACCLLRVSVLFWLISDPEDEGETVLRKVGCI